MLAKGIREDDIQKLHTTEPESMTDQELLLSTISATDLARKHYVGWDKDSLANCSGSGVSPGVPGQPEFPQVGTTEPLKYADTRFGTNVIMGRCLLSTKSIYRNL